mmetsp:Transcript_60880/g.89239  ORF Transcript_60880/g.89239 Transcript_60880/m.89239 type:complete len:92 (+) Transcript_60880:2382-2657(+)
MNASLPQTHGQAQAPVSYPRLPKVNEADQAAEKHAKLLQSAALQATPADAATAFAAAAVFLGRGERPPSAEEIAASIAAVNSQSRDPTRNY